MGNELRSGQATWTVGGGFDARVPQGVYRRGNSYVSTRAREIATWRALGFNSTSVVVSVLAESLALGALGGLFPALGSPRCPNRKVGVG